MARIQHEENEQIAFMNWCKHVHTEHGTLFELFIHIRNESFEAGTVVQRKRRIDRAKQAGYKTGTPDLFLPLPVTGMLLKNDDTQSCEIEEFTKPGLFIEMKRKRVKGKPRGRVSEAQNNRLALHQDCGYSVAVCEGWEEAKRITELYLEGKF